MAPTALRLPRSSRLRHRSDFTRIRSQGGRLIQSHLVLNWLVLPGTCPTRVGIIVSRRVGPAVVRNRARRLLRESVRLHQHELRGQVDLVLVARPSIAGRSFAEVETDFLGALRRACLLKEGS